MTLQYDVNCLNFKTILKDIQKELYNIKTITRGY